MVDDVTIPEIVRRVEGLDRRFSDFTRKELYERDIAEIKTRLEKIENAQTAQTRWQAGQFVTLVVALLMFILNQLPL